MPHRKWKPGQPDNWGHGHEGGEDCAGLIHEGLWNDFLCDDLISYICKKDQEESRMLFFLPSNRARTRSVLAAAFSPSFSLFSPFFSSSSSSSSSKTIQFVAVVLRRRLAVSS